jgi:hypothetical protein
MRTEFFSQSIIHNLYSNKISYKFTCHNKQFRMSYLETAIIKGVTIARNASYISVKHNYLQVRFKNSNEQNRLLKNSLTCFVWL